jgi:prepilin-type N-terminal cleavage/methylation domain-containing protein
MTSKTNGFTLIEMAIVVSVVAALTAIALPLYSSVTKPAKAAAMKSDLRNLATMQEAHFSDHQAYAPDASSMGTPLQASPNVTVFIDSATATGWGGTAIHSGTNSWCRIAYSRAGYQAPTCTEAPMVRIVDPGAGAAIDAGEVRFALAASGLGKNSGQNGGKGTVHHHLFLDRDVTPLSEPIPHGMADIIHLRPGQSELRVPGLARGQHEVIVVVTDDAHVPLLPAVTDTVRFTVKAR